MLPFRIGAEVKQGDEKMLPERFTSMSNLNGRICVFTGSRHGARSEYAEAARRPWPRFGRARLRPCLWRRQRRVDDRHRGYGSGTRTAM